MAFPILSIYMMRIAGSKRVTFDILQLLKLAVVYIILIVYLKNNIRYLQTNYFHFHYSPSHYEKRHQNYILLLLHYQH